MIDSQWVGDASHGTNYRGLSSRLTVGGLRLSNDHNIVGLIGSGATEGGDGEDW